MNTTGLPAGCPETMMWGLVAEICGGPYHIEPGNIYEPNSLHSKEFECEAAGCTPVEIHPQGTGDRMAAIEAEFLFLKNRRFPIQFGPSIPWNIIAPWEDTARRNHGQTLEMLAQRHGLLAAEAVAVLTGKSWRELEPSIRENGNERLLEIIAMRSKSLIPGATDANND